MKTALERRAVEGRGGQILESVQRKVERSRLTEHLHVPAASGAELEQPVRTARVHCHDRQAVVLILAVDAPVARPDPLGRTERAVKHVWLARRVPPRATTRTADTTRAARPQTPQRGPRRSEPARLSPVCAQAGSQPSRQSATADRAPGSTGRPRGETRVCRVPVKPPPVKMRPDAGHESRRRRDGLPGPRRLPRDRPRVG